MPIDLTISSAVAPAASPDRAQPSQHGQAYQPHPAATIEAKPAGPPPPSPTLRFDASADLLVIEFHNDAGAVTDSIPTQRQLEAYRALAEFGRQPAPPEHAASATTGAPAQQAPPNGAAS